jgi:hypothetical protein
MKKEVAEKENQADISTACHAMKSETDLYLEKGTGLYR